MGPLTGTMAGPSDPNGASARIAEHVYAAVVRASEALRPGQHEHRTAANRAFADQLESEIAPTVQLIRDAYGDNPALPDVIRSFLTAGAEPEHAATLLGGLIPAIIFGFAFNVLAELTPPITQSAVNAAWDANPVIPLSPAEAAVGVVKNVITPNEGLHEAMQSGVDVNRFATMVANTGNPPSPQQLSEAFRRGFIDEARFEHGILQGLSKDEWVDVYRKLRLGPPSAAEAITAAVQNHLDDATARLIVEQNGIEPANYDWMLQTAGRPPGIVQMLMAWNHGFVTEADVVQAIRESDVKNKYVPALLAMARHFMPMRSVAAAIAHGALSFDAGIAYLHQIGFSAEDAAIIANTSSAQKTATHKQASAGMVERAYGDRTLDAATATTRLGDLGYDPAEAGFILALKDAQVEQAREDKAVAVVGSQYVRRHVTRQHADTALDTIGVPAGRKASLLLDWDVERDLITKELPLSELTWAVNNHLLTVDEYTARLLGLGYAPADVVILVAHHAPAPGPAGTTP